MSAMDRFSELSGEEFSTLTSAEIIDRLADEVTALRGALAAQQLTESQLRSVIVVLQADLRLIKRDMEDITKIAARRSNVEIAEVVS